MTATELLFRRWQRQIAIRRRLVLCQNNEPANRERILAARILMVLSASIIFTLGVVHLVYTFWGPMLTPRDPALQISMSQISPVITKETTIWRCWVGFNASHSMGLMLFGLVFGFRFSRIGSRPTPLSVTVPARCGAGNAWWFCCALQGLFFQRASHRRLHFFGLLYRQHCAIARLTKRSSRPTISASLRVRSAGPAP